MVITITNADKSLIKIIETLNKKLLQPEEKYKDHALIW